MGEDDTKVEPGEPESLITLHDLYKSAQDYLIRTTEKSLDMDRKDLAGRLDDVLLRQRFWEDDIQLEEGALSSLEANDIVASSIIRRYLDDILHLLHDIDRILSLSPRYVSFRYALLHPLKVAGPTFRICACLAAIVAQLIVTSDANHEKDKVALLHETNSKLCDQVEIFDAIAANDTAYAAGNDRKATAIGQLRRQLEEDNKTRQQRAIYEGYQATFEEHQAKFKERQARFKERQATFEEHQARFKAKYAFGPSLSGELGLRTESIHHEMSSGKRKASPAPSSAITAPMPHSSATQDKHIGRPNVYWTCSDCKHVNSISFGFEKCENCGHTKCAACITYK